MKVLQLCIKPPFPPVDGGTRAMNSITQGLLDAGVEVWVLSVCSAKHPVQWDKMGSDYVEQTHFQAVELDLSVRPLEAMTALLCGESYHVKRFISKAFEHKLVETLAAEEFDIVHLESIFLTPYLETIRKHSHARVVLRAHNVEHQIWRKLATSTPNLLKRWYLKKLALTLGAYERENAGRFDAVACIAPADADFFRSLHLKRPIRVIPFGIDIPENEAHGEVSRFALYHLGAMDWMPNVESIRWFLNEVWGKVHAAFPQATLYLAGRRMPDEFLTLQMEGVKVVGEVDDAEAFVASKAINVVPLLSGSGIRVKIIEAMAQGKTVIATHTGAEGINYTENENILLADSPDAFVQQIGRCLTDDAFCHRIGRGARLLAEQEYDNKILTQRLLELYRLLLEKD